MVNNTVNQLQIKVKISLLHFRSKTHLFCNDLKAKGETGGTDGTDGTIKIKIIVPRNSYNYQ